LGKLLELESLPCGVAVEEGEGYKKNFALTEMTGNVRKMIAGRSVRTNTSRIIDTILEECVTMIGGVEGKDLRKGAFLRSLLSADRDFLLLKIRLISKGPIVVATMTCPSCQELLDVNIDIGGMDVYGFDPEKPDYMLDEKGRRVFEISDEGISAVFRYPDGHDQAAIAQIVRSNPIDAQYRMYHRCLVKWADKDGEKKEPFPSNFFDLLPVRRLDWINEEYKNYMPGPEMDTSVTCEVCGAETVANMDSSDFLFPQTRQKRSK
jgi:hypothetical protein